MGTKIGRKEQRNIRHVCRAANERPSGRVVEELVDRLALPIVVIHKPHSTPSSLPRAGPDDPISISVGRAEDLAMKLIR